jgi:hypothetical protein
MEPTQPFPAEATGNAGPELDPRLQPTPDYGTLGPASDVGGLAQASNQQVPPRRSAPTASLIAAIIGVVTALIVGVISKSHSEWPALSKFSSRFDNTPASEKDLGRLDRMGPQRQAEMLLQLAIAQNSGALEQISLRVDGWQGKLEWNSQMARLTTAALNSNDMRVRESGIEVELAAYGLGKNSASLEYLFNTAHAQNHSQKIWALWALGLMANRGVQPDKLVEILTSHLKDSDEDSRRWAAEALALSGSDQAIQALLKAMHDDPSALVRERAACGLAESGMFTPEQRMSAVPQLLIYSDDPALDAQTHVWAFQALNDITHQHLPNDSVAWRNWYQATITR